MNHYEILELSPDCTSKQIRTQYRKFAKVYHPDKNKGRNTYSEKFYKIQEAYDTLIDDELRRNYDNQYKYKAENEKESIPYVNSFRCESNTFIVGEPITFHWQVSGADYIEIKPFGRVGTLHGSKTVKLKAYIETLNVEIVAKNTKTGKFVSKSVSLKGVVKQEVNQGPIIHFFDCEAKDFSVGVPIKFYWRVTGADFIEIQPFGKVVNSVGSKVVKIKDNIEVLKTKIIAGDTKTGKFVSKSFNLKRKIIHNSKKIDDENKNSKEKESNIEKTSISGFVFIFIVIMSGVFGLFSLGLIIASSLTNNDYYVSDGFIKSAVPYLGLIGFILFIYAAYDEIE